MIPMASMGTVNYPDAKLVVCTVERLRSDRFLAHAEVDILVGYRAPIPLQGQVH
jgi:hypothetical protein